MLRFLTAYGATALTFLVLDALWLGSMAGRFYRPQLGDMLADGFRLVPAVAFYLIFVAGLVIFAVLPSLAQGSVRAAVISGGLFGLFTYATYNLTNYATMRHWTLPVTVVDMTWGVTVSALSAAAAVWIVRLLKV